MFVNCVYLLLRNFPYRTETLSCEPSVCHHASDKKQNGEAQIHTRDADEPINRHITHCNHKHEIQNELCQLRNPVFSNAFIEPDKFILIYLRVTVSHVCIKEFIHELISICPRNFHEPRINLLLKRSAYFRQDECCVIFYSPPNKILVVDKVNLESVDQD